MSIRVVRNDITKVEADCIVNSANPDPVIGGGAEAAIYEAAGKESLLHERENIGTIDPGEAFYTPAFKLHAKYVIHTVGPVWKDGSRGEAAILRACYENSLELALKLGCKSIAFPFISTGTYGFPKDKAIEIATSTINKFLAHNQMDVMLVVYDSESFEISSEKFNDVAEFIDNNYVDSRYSELPNGLSSVRGRNRARERENKRNYHVNVGGNIPDDVGELLKQSTASFSSRVLAIVEARGLDAPDVYNKDGILTKKIYSDMKNQGDDYRPKKGTAIGFCLALELDLPETLELLGSAGWTLSRSKKIDLIVWWHIERRDFNIRNINHTLHTFGFSDLDKYEK
ncbi:MAG: macro domain-containing protein [Clostridiales bacterium]|nr:macro domain-containing protein [Clostridiales bacterium]